MLPSAPAARRAGTMTLNSGNRSSGIGGETISTGSHRLATSPRTELRPFLTPRVMSSHVDLASSAAVCGSSGWTYCESSATSTVPNRVSTTLKKWGSTRSSRPPNSSLTSPAARSHDNPANSISTPTRRRLAVVGDEAGWRDHLRRHHRLPIIALSRRIQLRNNAVASAGFRLRLPAAATAEPTPGNARRASGTGRASPWPRRLPAGPGGFRCSRP